MGIIDLDLAEIPISTLYFKTKLRLSVQDQEQGLLCKTKSGIVTFCWTKTKTKVTDGRPRPRPTRYLLVIIGSLLNITTHARQWDGWDSILTGDYPSIRLGLMLDPKPGSGITS